MGIQRHATSIMHHTYPSLAPRQTACNHFQLYVHEEEQRIIYKFTYVTAAPTRHRVSVGSPPTGCEQQAYCSYARPHSTPQPRSAAQQPTHPTHIPSACNSRGRATSCQAAITRRGSTRQLAPLVCCKRQLLIVALHPLAHTPTPDRNVPAPPSSSPTHNVRLRSTDRRSRRTPATRLKASATRHATTLTRNAVT